MRRISFLLIAVLIAFVSARAFAANCVPAKEEIVKKKAGSCEIRTAAGRFTKDLFYIDYSSASLVCGDKTVIDGAPIVASAREACMEADASQGVALPYSMTKDLSVVSDYKNLISVETNLSGFTGGAHPYAVVKRATYDGKTGKAVTLDDLYGKDKSTKIVAEARKLFDKKSLAPYYRFEPDSFSVAGSPDGKVKITFAAPHEVELYRGTNLDVAVSAPAPALK